MLTVYRNIKQFCMDIFDTSSVAIKLIVTSHIEYLIERITWLREVLDNEVALLRARINEVAIIRSTRLENIKTYFTARYNELSEDISEHAADKTNPHNVKMSHLSIISATSPVVDQGAAGDFWLEYAAGYDVARDVSVLTAQDIVNVRNACVALYMNDPLITLSVGAGNLATLYDTRLVGGTSGVSVQTNAYNRLNQAVGGVTVDTSNLPKYFDGTQFKKMTMAEFRANFIDPIGALGYNPYIISTAQALSGYALVSTIPVFSDTRAVANTDSAQTIANYYLHRKIGGMVVNLNNLSSLFSFDTPVNIASQFLNLVKYVLRNTAGYQLRYNINGAGTTLGTAMVDTRLNSSVQGVIGSGYYVYTYYRPAGAAIVVNYYAFRGYQV